MTSNPPLDSPVRPGSRRRPWVAALLSLVLSGLGHTYAGQPRRGIALWAAAFIAGLLGLFALVVLPSTLALAAFLLLIIAPPIAVAVDAWRAAQRAAPDYHPHWFNRWYWYAGAFVLVALIVQPRLKHLLNRTVAQSYTMASAAMSPLYEEGDYVLVSPLRDPPLRGEPVVYGTRLGPYLDRVVGVPGDTIAMCDGHLIVNGRTAPEPYVSGDSVDDVANEFGWQRPFLAPSVDRAAYAPSLRTWGPLVIPPAEYFVLGDNRGESMDSRYTGFVPRDSIVARPVMVYFSWDPDAHAARWNRIGAAHN